MKQALFKSFAVILSLLVIFTFTAFDLSGLAYAEDEEEGPVKYAIKISEDIVNGSISTESEAAEEQEVDVYVTPDDGYNVDSLTVMKNDGSGEEVPFIYNFGEGNDKGSYGYFMMPPCEVLISVTFVEKNPDIDDKATYTVTFVVDKDENVIGDGEFFTQEVKEGEKAVRPEDPEKEGYEFTGWYLYPELTEIQDCVDLYDFDLPVTDNIRLIAKYEFVDVEHGDPEPLPDPCKDGHDFGDVIVERPADCEMDGEAFRECKRCGAQETVEMPKLGHDYSGVWVVIEEPTCTKDGLEVTTCKRCSQSDMYRSIPALEHTWDSGIVTVEPTENEEGVKTYTCTVCGETKIEDIPKLDPAEPEPVAPIEPVTPEDPETPDDPGTPDDPTPVDPGKPDTPGEDVTPVPVPPEPEPISPGDVTPVPGGSETQSTIKLTKSNTKVTGIKNRAWTGKKRIQTITVKVKGKTLKRGTDYSLTYKNRTNVGTATITIKGKGNYTGTIKKTFEINPKGAILKKLTAKKKALKVTWNKQSKKMSTKRITGYQIQVATNAKFTKNVKKVKVAGYKKTSTTIKKLKAKKTYYVRIRTYTKVSNKTYYSAWSKVLKKKTK